MRFATVSAALAAFASTAAAVPVSDAAAASPSLSVKLSQIDNTRVKAVVTNSGKEDVDFVHLNFFRDSAPVKKVSVFRGKSEVQFEGVKRRFRMNGLTKEAITSLAAGDSIEDEFDIASTADLAKGGTITLNSKGFVPIVKNGKVTGYIPYTSNQLDVDVDGPKASQIKKTIAQNLRRTSLESCSGSQKSALEKALSNAADLATQAADAAESGDDDKFEEYFKTTDKETRSTVAERLRAVAKEASSTSGGSTKYYCEDTLGYCEPNVLAYTLPSQDVIANCDIYYSELPALAEKCHAQDQATTTLHEFTHAPGVYSPGTDDLGYGYDAATQLSATDALNNADSYALYANAIELKC
ncbi:neutral protease II [Aspergillus affinis]|uniref:neutral protease II n=1 Tax=Aspergillus affinis TaxID=1070780 RepID=UPI0022FEC09C|nr:neutral protease II [Aspergillus affinis]KAI9038261.1 neutral protease II [Aspergillus affinis]